MMTSTDAIAAARDRVALIREGGGWTVTLDGRDITGMKPRDVWRLGVGRTFQITTTFASMSVRENVQMALISHAGETWTLFGRAKDRHVAVAEADELGDAGPHHQPVARLQLGFTMLGVERSLVADDVDHVVVALAAQARLRQRLADQR